LKFVKIILKTYFFYEFKKWDKIQFQIESMIYIYIYIYIYCKTKKKYSFRTLLVKYVLCDIWIKFFTSDIADMWLTCFISDNIGVLKL